MGDATSRQRAIVSGVLRFTPRPPSTSRHSRAAMRIVGKIVDHLTANH